jgi:transcriptional regulator with XRE-family HTH domain
MSLSNDSSKARVRLGNAIRKARIDKGWQQQDLQEETKISQTYLSKIECGKADPSISIVHKIAKALGVSLDRLVKEEKAHGKTH